MGGAWEELIKSVKKIITRLFNEEALHTFICEKIDLSHLQSKISMITKHWPSITCCLGIHNQIMHQVYFETTKSIIEKSDVWFKQQPLHKKWSFLLRIFSVNVTKSAGNFIFCAVNQHVLELLPQEISVMRCVIWYHLYNLKNVKNSHGGVLSFCQSLSCFTRNSHKSLAVAIYSQIQPGNC